MIDSQAQAQIQDFIHVLKKRRWMILLPALFVFTLGSAFAAIVPKKYVVETEIEIKPSRVPSDYQLRNPHESAAAREVENAEQHIKNYNRIKRVINQSHSNWPEYAQAGPAKQDEMIRTVRDNLAVEVEAKKNSQGSTFVKITYRDPNQERSALFLNDLREAWLEDVVAWDLNTMEGERDALFDQKLESDSEVEKLRSDYSGLCQELGIDGMALLAPQTGTRGPESDYVFTQLEQMTTARDDTKAQLEGLRGELEINNRLFENEPLESVEIRTDPGVNYAEKIGLLQTEIEKVRGQMERMTPANSKFRTLERRIQELNRNIQDLEVRQREGGTIEVPIPNPRRLEYAAERDRLAAEVAGLEEKVAFYNAEIDRMRKDVNQRTKKYDDLARIQNQLKLALEANAEVGKELARWTRNVKLLEEGSGQPYDIAAPAVAETAPQEPNPYVIALFSGLLGLALGLFLALIVEYGSNTYRTVTELASVMTVPVLGTIEPIVTHAELRRAQFRRAMVGFSTAILLGGIAWVTYVYKSSPEKLPVEIQQALDSLELALR